MVGLVGPPQLLSPYQQVGHRSDIKNIKTWMEMNGPVVAAVVCVVVGQMFIATTQGGANVHTIGLGLASERGCAGLPHS